jgi:O-antigen ligase
MMHTANLHQTWPGIGIAAPRSGMIAYARALTFTVWMFSLLFAYWWISDWFTLQELAQSGFNRKEYYYYGFALVFIGHLTLGFEPWLATPFNVLSDWTGRFITLFCLLMMCLSPWSLLPRASLIYACATLITVGLMSLFWVSNYRVLNRVLVFTGFVVFGWLFILMFRHGLTFGFGGWIGGINRNSTGTAALAGMVCALLSPNRRIRWAAIACAIFMVVVVSSRGSIVAMTIFFAVYLTLYMGTGKASMTAIIGGMVFGLVLLTSPFVYDLIVERIFHLHDRVRGLGTGFTGRVSMWQEAIDAFWKQPLTGYGFRSASLGVGEYGGVHSGWLKIFLECGVIGGFLVIAAMVCEIVYRINIAVKIRALSSADAPGIDLPKTLRLNIVACATFFMLATMWVYDQYYINLGSPVSVVFFLYLMAPTWITNEGVTIRR